MPDLNTHKPQIDLDAATAAAQQYLGSRSINLDDRSLTSSQWCDVSSDGKWGWLLIWMTEEQVATARQSPSMRGGGALMVVVAGNGSVSHSFAR